MSVNPCGEVLLGSKQDIHLGNVVNPCYFCGSSAPFLMKNYNVPACIHCRHLYKDVPYHIPVTQVKRYYMRINQKKLYRLSYVKKSLDTIHYI